MNSMISTPSAPASGLTWLMFSLLTVVCWGCYGVLLHAGQTGMNDAVNGRYKAFLFVGIAYFLIAVIAPLAALWVNGATWAFPLRGISWSLIAGLAGAVGAFAVLLAFGARGTPAVVMSIVFAGAPVVNAIYTLAWHPPAGGWLKLPWPFVLGILLAAIGGCLVSLYKPAPGPPAASPNQVRAPAVFPPVSATAKS